jgi:E3 ubiquitin-protein ligase DOA10
LIQLPISVLRIVIDPLVDFILDFCIPKALQFVQSLAKQHLPALMSHPALVNALDGFQTIKEHGMTLIHSFTQSDMKGSKQYIEHLDVSGGQGHDLVESILAFVHHDLEPLLRKGLKRWQYFAIGRTVMDRIVCVAIGYMILVLLGAWYLRKTGNAYGRTVGRTVQQAIRQQGIILKVAFFISIELVLFPIVCGILLDISTLPLIGSLVLGSCSILLSLSPFVATLFVLALCGLFVIQTTLNSTPSKRSWSDRC